MIESPLQRRAPLPPQLTRRVGVLGALAFLLFAIIGFRLWYLQVLTGTQNVAAETQNVLRNIPIAAPRGEIVDRNGRPLAGTRVAAEVAIVKDDLPPSGPERRALYRRLGRVLGMRWQDIRATVENLALAPPGYAPTTIKVDVGSYALTYLAERAREFPGVLPQQVYLRDYPHGKVGAAVLGQIGQITGPLTSTHPELGTPEFKGILQGTYVGQDGLEATYQPYLQGKTGVERIQVNASGLPTGVPPKVTAPTAGQELKTSLDLGLEEEGYIAVRKAMAFAQANGKHATAAAFVAMDPFSGRVLALGSWPSYDPNAFAKPLGTSQFDAILHSTALVDRAIDGVYPTGSTFKPIVAWGALRTGLITGQTTQGAGSCLAIGGVTFCNAGRANFGDKNLVDALTVSEDTFFYLVGQNANGPTGDGHAIQNAARALGLGSSPGIDLPGRGARGTVPDRRWVDNANKQILAAQCKGHVAAAYKVACAQGFYYPDWTVGQNIGLATGQSYLQASPLQMAVAYSAIVNGGTVWTPQIGTQIDSPSGAIVAQLPSPTFRRVYIDPAYQGLIMAGLHGAAQSPAGTSYAVFHTFPRTVYGKTGTAVRTGQKDQSWYVAYVPDPKRPIVVAVTIEQGGFGAAAAAPAARMMLARWFGLPKTFVPGSNPDH